MEFRFHAHYNLANVTLVRTPIIEDLPKIFETVIPYQKGLIFALETHYATQRYQGQSDDTQIRDQVRDIHETPPWEYLLRTSGL
jgi:hypothetical protein